MILAGDIGGTNARLGLFDARMKPLKTAAYQTAEHDDFVEIIDRFVAGTGASIHVAAFGVAATVANGRATGVNLPWELTEGELSALLGYPVTLVNDLAANARGIDSLGPRDIDHVNRGVPVRGGNQAVVSAGTGLGEAARWWDGEGHRVVATEGGHSDFAPRNEIEVQLYRHLTKRYGHVSYERVCSGAGLSAIYGFLRGPNDARPEPHPAEITAEAATDPRSIGAHALHLFTSIYGARAGNVALSVMATGGVYLGGGIPPKIATSLKSGPFMRAFVGKGRFTPLLHRIPVRLILNDRTALLGAAQIAAEHAPAPVLPLVRYS